MYLIFQSLWVFHIFFTLKRCEIHWNMSKLNRHDIDFEGLEIFWTVSVLWMLKGALSFEDNTQAFRISRNWQKI